MVSRTILDPIEAWRAREAHDASIELWEKLHRQGGGNSALYAAVGEIVRMMQEQAAPDWNAYSLIAFIEEGVSAKGSPSLPAELGQDYKGARVALL